MQRDFNPRRLLEELRQAVLNDQPAVGVLLGEAYTSAFPHEGFPWMLYGIALYESANYQLGRKSLRRAIRLAPEGAARHPLSQLGHLYKQKGDFKRATDWYRRAVSADQEHASAYIYLGGTLACMGRLEEAEHVYRAATRCTQGCLDEAYHNLGLVLRAQRKLKPAIRAFEHALAICPAYAEAETALEDVTRALRWQKQALRIG